MGHHPNPASNLGIGVVVLIILAVLYGGISGQHLQWLFVPFVILVCLAAANSMKKARRGGGKRSGK